MSFLAGVSRAQFGIMYEDGHYWLPLAAVLMTGWSNQLPSELSGNTKKGIRTAD